jgi:uridylate kinase
MKPKFRRILIKISGEALAGVQKHGLDQEMLVNISSKIKEVYDMGVEIAIVVGGGNFWRGRTGKGMDRTTADHMGMMATVINALALQDALEARGLEIRVQTAIDMRQIAEPYIRRKAVGHLRKGRVVIFACGTGNPYFSTDTTAALRAAEIDAEIILLAKNVDGVYDADPHTHSHAKKYEKIGYMELLNKGLGVMDATAASLCMDNKIPIVVFGLENPENIKKVVQGQQIGTIIQSDEEGK